MGHVDWFDPPTLTGALIRLEPLALHHAEGYLAAADAPEVFAHLNLPGATSQPQSLADAQLHIDQAGVTPGRVAFAQVDVRTGTVAGSTSFYEVSPATRSLAIGYTWLGRRWWRQGHNTESKLLLLGHAFESLGAVRVVWHTDIRNDRSQAAIARLGATREGVLRKHKQRKDGSWRDTVQYAMTDEDWPAARDRLRERMRSAQGV